MGSNRRFTSTSAAILVASEAAYATKIVDYAIRAAFISVVAMLFFLLVPKLHLGTEPWLGNCTAPFSPPRITPQLDRRAG